MVKKLFKHEFLAYARVMCVIYAILLTVASACRIIQFFETDSISYVIVASISFTSYGVSAFAAMIFSFAFAIVRFYRNLFTAEGYLSFTLPVTPAQHILVKLLTALGVGAISFAMLLLSGCIISAGEMLKEIFLALDYLLDQLYAFAKFHTVFFGLETLLAVLLWASVSLLLYYTFISIGQTFKKNRILAAVGAYFVYYILTQVVSSIITIALTVFVPEEFMQKVGSFMAQHPIASVHIVMWIGIVLAGIFGSILFFVIRRIITKKLNLE